MARHPNGVPFSYKGLTDHRMGIPGDSYYWHIVNENFAKNAVGVAIHHSVTGDVHPDAIARGHINRWGSKAGVGYHFIISRNGKTWYVGDLGTQRAHIVNQNHRYIGVCLLGEHHKYAPTKAQYESANKLYREIEKKFGVKKLVKHNDLQATACPGSFTDMTLIRNGYPAPATPAPTPLLTWTKLPSPVNYILNKDTNLWNFNTDTWTGIKAVKAFKKGDEIRIFGSVRNNKLNATYLLTEYSFNSKITNGFNQVDLTVKPAITPEPEPAPDVTPDVDEKNEEPQTGIDTPTPMKDAELRAMLYGFFYGLVELIKNLLTKLKGE